MGERHCRIYTIYIDADAVGATVAVVQWRRDRRGGNRGRIQYVRFHAIQRNCRDTTRARIRYKRRFHGSHTRQVTTYAVACVTVGGGGGAAAVVVVAGHADTADSCGQGNATAADDGR